MITTLIIIAIIFGVGAALYGVLYHTGVQKKIENSVLSTYKKIEDGVVSGYNKMEDSVVSGYKKVESTFVPSDNYKSNK